MGGGGGVTFHSSSSGSGVGSLGSGAGVGGFGGMILNTHWPVTISPHVIHDVYDLWKSVTWQKLAECPLL